MLIATVACILLAKYGILESTNLQIRCTCHVVNLVVQDILAALGEADDPDDIDYYLLNKEQPFHLDINTDSDQVELDNEEFEDDGEGDEDLENITMEEEEKLKATASSLSKVCSSLGCPIFDAILMITIATLYYKQNRINSPVEEEVSLMRNCKVFQEKCGA